MKIKKRAQPGTIKETSDLMERFAEDGGGKEGSPEDLAEPQRETAGRTHSEAPVIYSSACISRIDVALHRLRLGYIHQCSSRHKCITARK